MQTRAPDGRGAAPRRSAARSMRTRAKLVEVAGQMFSDLGFDGATGHDICRKAGVHSAAIVYHFGGMTGLYRAVLEEARARLVTTEALAEAVNAESNPRRKLEAFLGMIVRVLTSPVSQSWAGRLFGREFVTPSSVYGNAHDRALVARARMLKSIVAALTGRYPGDPGGPRLRQRHRTVRVAAAGQSPQAQADAAELGPRSRCGAAAHPAPGRFRAGRASRDLHAAGAAGAGRLAPLRSARRTETEMRADFRGDLRIGHLVARFHGLDPRVEIRFSQALL